MKAWLRENWKGLLGGLLGLVPAVLITLAIGWVIWGEMDRWYSTTHVENMVGQVWEVKSSDNVFEIEVLFTETTQIFTYEGSLPDYVVERQYVRALFQFSPDNDRILEFLGPTNGSGLYIPKPYLWMFAIVVIIAIVGTISYILYQRSSK